MADEDEDELAFDPESRARTHMASERTFLSWLRTGITFIALGLAAAQFLARDLIPGLPVTRSIAIALVVIGVFLALTGARRYQVTYRRVEARTFRPASRSVAIATSLMVLVGLLSIIFILLLRP